MELPYPSVTFSVRRVKPLSSQSKVTEGLNWFPSKTSNVKSALGVTLSNEPPSYSDAKRVIDPVLSNCTLMAPQRGTGGTSSFIVSKNESFFKISVPLEFV